MCSLISPRIDAYTVTDSDFHNVMASHQRDVTFLKVEVRSSHVTLGQAKKDWSANSIDFLPISCSYYLLLSSYSPNSMEKEKKSTWTLFSNDGTSSPAAWKELKKAYYRNLHKSRLKLHQWKHGIPYALHF